MTHQLRSMTMDRPRALLLAVTAIITLLIAGPAAAGCSVLDELPTVGVPQTPEVSVDKPLH